MYQIYGVNDAERFKKLKSLEVPIVETDTINPNKIHRIITNRSALKRVHFFCWKVGEL